MNRRGFAMPMVILAIVVLAVTLTVSLSVASSETATNTSIRGQGRAYTLAQQGLELYLAGRADTAFWNRFAKQPLDSVPDMPTNTPEELTLTLPGGLAKIRAQLVRPLQPGGAPALYFVSSVGIDSTPGPSNTEYRTSGRVVAHRGVGIYATYNTNVLNVMASWLSLTGLVKNGTGTISGVDMCGKKADMAGVLVPKGGLQVQGQSAYFGGTPPVDTSKNQDQLKASTGIDWDAVKNQNSIVADFVVPPASFPTAAWFNADTTRWPIIRVENSGGSEFSLPNVGRGMLIVEGDLSISGDNMWSGVILVGGKLTSNGKNVVAGATLSGLDALLPGYVDNGNTKSKSGDDATANGNKSYIYNSCSVEKATKKLQAYNPLPNTWVDNVPVW
ncbi:MAG: type IV pilus modification PilV family protein [Gemmatimonadaceae bacterium]